MRKAILHLKKADPVLSSLIQRVGRYGIQYREPNFETLVRSIVYQQLSGKVAAVIFGRLAGLTSGGKLTPQAILRLTPAKMRKAGLSKQKTAYIRDLARKTARGALKFETLTEMADHEVIERLTQVKGIGVWTAHMFLMFTLRRPNILPVGDFGVRMAMYRHYLDKRARHGAAKNGVGKRKGKAKKVTIKLPTPEQMEKIAKGWEPYRSIACWYLWQSLDTKTMG